MTDKETQPLDAHPGTQVLGIEEMEQRLEAQITGPFRVEDSLCVWYACTDVCPPGG